MWPFVVGRDSRVRELLDLPYCDIRRTAENKYAQWESAERPHWAEHTIDLRENIYREA